MVIVATEALTVAVRLVNAHVVVRMFYKTRKAIGFDYE